MADTYCDYNYSMKVEDGKTVDMVARFYSGNYYEVVEGVFVYQRDKVLIDAAEVVFDKFPVTEQEIKEELLDMLNSIKGNLEVIPECL